MTEQATLAPEQAVLALAEAVCLWCKGFHIAGTYLDRTLESGGVPCAYCRDADNEPTGARFNTLRVECIGVLIQTENTEQEYCCERCGWLDGSFIHAEDCEPCDGRGWSPIAWTDEYTIRLALQDQGIRVEYQHRRWYVKLPGTTTAEGYDDNLAVAADSATRAEGVR